MRSKRKALLIGIPGGGLRDLPPLPPLIVREDLRSMNAALESSGYDVEILKIDVMAGKTGSAMDLRFAIDQFIENGKKGDTRVLYLSGHGVNYRGQDYFVPADGENALTREAYYEKGLIPIDFRDAASRSNATATIVFVDACRHLVDPGAKAPGEPLRRRIGGNYLRRMRPGSPVLTIFACSIDQPAQYELNDKTNEKFSLFTCALAEALDATHRARTLADVYEHVQIRVEELVTRYKRSIQVPDRDVHAVRHLRRRRDEDVVFREILVCDGAEAPAVVVPGDAPDPTTEQPAAPTRVAEPPFIWFERVYLLAEVHVGSRPPPPERIYLSVPHIGGQVTSQLFAELTNALEVRSLRLDDEGKVRLKAAIRARWPKMIDRAAFDPMKLKLIFDDPFCVEVLD